MGNRYCINWSLFSLRDWGNEAPVIYDIWHPKIVAVFMSKEQKGIIIVYFVNSLSKERSEADCCLLGAEENASRHYSRVLEG